MLDLSKKHFYIEDGNGNLTKHDILFSFDCDGNTYIVHSTGEEDENGNVMAYASCYNKELYGDNLVDIESDDAFETIQQVFVELLEMINKDEDKTE